MQLPFGGAPTRQMLDWYNVDGKLLIEGLTVDVLAWEMNAGTADNTRAFRLQALLPEPDARLLLDGLSGVFDRPDRLLTHTTRSVSLTTNPDVPYMHSHYEEHLEAISLGLVLVHAAGERWAWTVTDLRMELPGPRIGPLAKMTFKAVHHFRDLP